MQRSADTSKSSHEPPMEPRAYVEPGSGKHSVQTHSPKDPNCDVCFEDQKWQGLLAEDALPQSCPERKISVIWSLQITIVPSAGCESRNNHRYAVVVQDLATQWLQSYPCKTKTSQETQKNLRKFTAWELFSLMDEISVVSWSSDQVGRSQSVCLRRFRSMSG